MMGVDIIDPYTPPLLMVKVPPAMSSMLMVPSRAFLPRAPRFCHIDTRGVKEAFPKWQGNSRCLVHDTSVQGPQI